MKQKTAGTELSLNNSRDRPFAAYLRGTVGGKGGWIRVVSAVCFSAALIVSQGVSRVEVVVGALVGGVALAYPLWRRWGRSTCAEFKARSQGHQAARTDGTASGAAPATQGARGAAHWRDRSHGPVHRLLGELRSTVADRAYKKGWLATETEAHRRRSAARKGQARARNATRGRP